MSEFPPVIIDSSGIIDGGTTLALPNLTSHSGSVVVRGDDFGTALSTEPVTIRPSSVTLYLIKDNGLIHKGDFSSDQVKLILGTKPERAMAVGIGAAMSFGADKDFEAAGADGHSRRTFQSSAKVHTIHVPGEEKPLKLGRDFHNFILIVRRKVGEPKGEKA